METFTSKESEYVFYLTKLEGKTRNRLLGVTDEHYESKQKADDWYEGIKKIVSNAEALKNLDEIYQVMISDN